MRFRHAIRLAFASNPRRVESEAAESLDDLNL
jgi:hypothetical protein